MSVTKEQENKFEEVMRDAMKKQFYRGLAVGAQSVCKVILDLMNDTSLPLMKRIDVVKNYCNKSLKNGKMVFGDDNVSVQEEQNDDQNHVDQTQEDKHDE